MKPLFFISAFLLTSIYNAQDKLALKSGEEIDSKIILITKSKITYVKYANEAGPQYEIDKKNCQKY